MKTGLAGRMLLVLMLTCQCADVLASGKAIPHSELFDRLIEESGMSFTPPPGFVDIEPEVNPVQPYEGALRHVSGEVEIRYIIRPLGRISIDYTDPHNAAPEPDHLFPLLFESLTARLSGGGNTPQSEYPQTEARDLFNADWASASAFDVNPEFSGSYSQALMVGIHRNGRADAYTVFLYNEPVQAKEIIKTVLSALTFEP